MIQGSPITYRHDVMDVASKFNFNISLHTSVFPRLKFYLCPILRFKAKQNSLWSKLIFLKVKDVKVMYFPQSIVFHSFYSTLGLD